MSQFFILVMSFFSTGIFQGDSPAGKDEFHQETELVMTTYFFIRHAEKDESDPAEKDPALTDDGLERTVRWERIFREVSFDLVYSTDYKRTLQTATPIARAHDAPVLTYDASRVNDENFRETTRGKTVLVVGHSNTNPKFVNSILGEDKYKDIDESESGSLFMVTGSASGETSSQVLYIN